MSGVTQLGYLGISASDMAAWEQYATEVLGVQVSERAADGSLFLRMDENHYRIAVHPTGADDLAYVGWQVADEQALTEVAERLHAAGVTVERDPELATSRRVRSLIRFDDPNGVQSEVYYGPAVEFENPFHSPRPIGGFVTGEQGLGHILIGVNDLDQSIGFYRDVLGFRISDYIEMSMGPRKALLAFFHVNPRHHSLAFGAIPSPKRLNHIMLQVNKMDDVGSTYYMVQERGIPIQSTLGRHTNDHMFSFYMATPSGFGLEYGWGGREIDDTIWQVQTHTRASTWGHQRAAAPQPAAAARG